MVFFKTKTRGTKFRRQHPLGLFIADFYCHKAKLVIEIDGSIHNKMDVQLYDAERQKALEEIGLKVMRFTNDQIFKNVEEVLSSICNYVKFNDRFK